MNANKTLLIVVYLVLVLVMSLAAFVIYGIDKKRAGVGGRRIPEQTLHFLAFLGGGPGAWLAQRHFRHKTKKTSFQIFFWCVIVLHLVAVMVIGWAL